VFAFFLHDLVGPGQQNGGSNEGHVDKDLPLDLLEIFIRNIDERFQEMNAGNADQLGGEFNFNSARVDMSQPVRSIGMSL